MTQRTTLLALTVPIVFGMGLLRSGPIDSGVRISSEEEAIREAIGHYFEGHATGQGTHFSQVFHPESKLFWIDDEGRLSERTSAEYISRASGDPPEDEAERDRRIENIDVTGNAAVVKVILDYPGAEITDYMSMLKIDGRWWIVNKTFTWREKSAAAD
jgi:hypothetical protein